MRSTFSLRLRAGIVSSCAFAATAATLALSAGTAHAQAAACNNATFQVLTAPDTTFSGPLNIMLFSSCGAAACFASVNITPSTTTVSKCTSMVNAITASCAASGYTVSSNLCSTSSQFTVTEPSCSSVLGKGVTLGVSNSLTSGSYLQTGWLPNYEQDKVTTCAGVGGALNNLSGIATGMPIVVGSQSNLVFTVFASPVPVTEEVQTTPLMTAAQVVTAAMTLLNDALAATGSSTQCRMDGANSFRCAASGTGANEIDVAVTAQLNDTGFAQFQFGGPATDVTNIQTAIVTTGGIKNAQTFNPVSGTPSVPSLNGWGAAMLALMLGASSFFLVRRRSVGSRLT